MAREEQEPLPACATAAVVDGAERGGQRRGDPSVLAEVRPRSRWGKWILHELEGRQGLHGLHAAGALNLRRGRNTKMDLRVGSDNVEEETGGRYKVI